MDPIIEIEEKAAAFIKQQGGVVTVRFSPRHGCCGGTSRIVIVEVSLGVDVSAMTMRDVPPQQP